jgi:hypothetical protein
LLSSDTTFYVSQQPGSGSSGLRITECGLGNPDYLEIENVSGTAIDATGWVAVVSNSYTDINLVNTIAWNLGMFNAGEIKYQSDGTNDNYWGNNMLWNPGSNSWAMIVDDAGAVVDFVAWGWTDTEIQALSTTVNGFLVSIGAEWTGNAPVACPAPNSVSRTGSGDHNNTSDFACEAETKGAHNLNLATVCASALVSVDITLVPGITVYIGNDTILQTPFSYVIDAGTGFNSYQWSTGESTQSITVTGGGIYWVTVTGGPNGCSATDTILVNYIVGMESALVEDDVRLFPNPGSGLVTISGLNPAGEARQFIISDVSGRTIIQQKMDPGAEKIILDVSALADGIYTLQVKKAEGILSRKLVVQHAGFK